MARKNRFYPHLLQPDIELWERFLKLHESEYKYFDYDVRIGKGRPAEDLHNDNIKKMALDLSMRRIDAIGYKSNEIQIIEITCFGDLKALGQLQTYPQLYKETFSPVMPVTTLLLAERLGADIEQVLIENKYNYMLIPKPELVN